MAVNVSDDLRDAARRDPEGIALIEPRSGRRVTWAQFDQWADRVAQTLVGRGVLAGQRVALVMANGIDLAVAYYGILRGGQVVVPINPRATPREISRMVEACAPRLVVADAQSITQVREADTGDSVIVVHRAAPEEGASAGPAAARSARARTVSPAIPCSRRCGRNGANWPRRRACRPM